MGFTEIYERIKLATNCRTQVELAELLNIRQSSISDAKRRDSVPGDWYMKLFERFGLNPDWLKYGVGPLYLRTEKGYCPQEAPQALAETVACYGDDFTRSTVVDVYDMACIYTDEAPRPALSVSSRMSAISLALPCFTKSIILSITASMVVVYGNSVISMQLFFLSN